MHFIFFTALSVSTCAQSEAGDSTNSLTEEILELFQVDQKPEFLGGADALNLWLRENIKYPPNALKNNVEGKVYITFVVEKDGTLSNIKVLRELGAGCTAEAVRLVNLMPPWSPGKYLGQNVRVRFTIPIEFKIQL